MSIYLQKLKFIFLLLLVTLVALGCQRPQADSAKVKIAIPSASEFRGSSKINGLAAIDYDKLCFLVNIKGAGIPSAAASCEFERGLTFGTVAPGKEITLDVPIGNDRSFEVYGFLRTSAAEACPQIPANGLGWPLTKVYFLGEKTAVEVFPPEISVSIQISLPNSNDTLMARNHLPASCANANQPPRPNTAGRLQVNSATLAGSAYKLSGRIAEKNEDQILESAHYKLSGVIQ